MDIKVTYMSGAGNLFTVIDNREYKFPKEILSKLAPTLCSGRIPTEGLLAISDSSDFDFDADFYNPDGSSGVMCGNGGRCSVLFAGQLNFFGNAEKSIINFSMAGEIYKAKLENNSVSLFMPPPIKILQRIQINEDFFSGKTDYINVNSDHIVFDFNDIEHHSDFFEFDLINFARPLRNLTKLFPNGTNVNVYFIDSDNIIHLRTYERGVEAETASCGTGATSTAISIALAGLARFPITILPKSKSTLIIDIVGDFPNNIDSLILKGSAEIIGYDLYIIDNKELN